MHRIGFVVACALLGACFFDADYRSGTYRCSDGACPSGLSCVAGECVAPKQDAALGDADGGADASFDARIPAMTCVDPGAIASTGGQVMGTTAGRSNLVTASCSGFVMNGPDAVYKVTVASGAQLLVSISGSYSVVAYVLQPCSAAPATPVCATNMAAMPNNPISVTATAAGDYYVVVDGPNAVMSGTYTLTVNVN